MVAIKMSSSTPVVYADSQTTVIGTSNELPKRIMMPLDGSDISFRAADYGINLAKLRGGEILCVHAVVDLPYIEYMVPSVLTVLDRYRRQKNRQKNGFSQVKSKAAKQGVKITAETIFNPPSVSESIINYASKQKADLLVIGTRGRSALKRMVLGSVASAVVAHADSPVLVIR